MKSLQTTTLSLVVTLLLVTSLPTQASNYATLRADMEAACPIVWEDLGVAISASVPQGDVWAGNTVDKDAFAAFYQSNEGGTLPEAQTVAGLIDAVSAYCASYRLALVDELIGKTTTDVNNALTAAGGSGMNSYLGGAWTTGDVRTTGRNTAAEGWVFLLGQSVGNTGSGADLAGSQYQALFELVNSWDSASTKTWANGDTVTLPDMRGRGIYGADNMGGTSVDVLTQPNAETIGGEVGVESVVLAVDQMPSHTHTMQSGGVHNHSMSTNGSHEHKLRTSVHPGSGSAHSDWKWFEGRARPNWQNTIQKGSGAVVAAGNHSHTINNSSSHTHVNNATGGSTPLATVSPGIVFNVEMKY